MSEEDDVEALSELAYRGDALFKRIKRIKNYKGQDSAADIMMIWGRQVENADATDKMACRIQQA